MAGNKGLNHVTPKFFLPSGMKKWRVMDSANEQLIFTEELDFEGTQCGNEGGEIRSMGRLATGFRDDKAEEEGDGVCAKGQ